jgi:hypothetical protein
MNTSTLFHQTSDTDTPPVSANIHPPAANLGSHPTPPAPARRRLAGLELAARLANPLAR